jgi:arylsulfatase A-like enzyme
MRSKYLLFLMISLMLVACRSQTDKSQKSERSPLPQPNILFILADDLGYEKLSCYGGLDVQTPNIDALAKTGTRFTKAYTSPVCTPSRMSIYTGLYALNHGYTRVIPIHNGSQHAVDFQQFKTFPQLLQTAGYHTAVTGKWQLAALEYHPQHCQEAGFNSWCVWQIWKEGQKTKRYWDHTYNQDGQIQTKVDSIFGPDLMADYVIDQMAKAKTDKRPFYIHHNMVLPHVPIIPTPKDLQNKQAPSLDQMIQYVDGIVGKLVKAVDSLGLSNQTYIIFAGDNGTQSEVPRNTVAGEVNGGKWQLNDAGIHVPLIVKSPQTNTKLVCNDLIDFADFFPTICALAGIQIPESYELDGLSFQESITGSSRNKRPWVTGAIDQNAIVFDGNWRLDYPSDQLTDCRNLPLEKEVLDPKSPLELKAYDSLRLVLENLRKDLQVQKMD